MSFIPSVSQVIVRYNKVISAVVVIAIVRRIVSYGQFFVIFVPYVVDHGVIENLLAFVISEMLCAMAFQNSYDTSVSESVRK